MTNHKKQLTTIGFAIILLGGLAWALLPGATEVTWAEVKQEDFAETITEEGQTTLRDPHPISAPIQGYLQRVELEPGDVVAAGDPLVAIEPLPAPALDRRAYQQAAERVAGAEARQKAMLALLENLRSEQEFAEKEQRRIQDLHEREGASDTELDRAETAARRADTAKQAAAAAVEAAYYEAENARAVLAVTAGERHTDDYALTLKAPVSGTVLERHMCCAGVVTAGTPILDIGELETLEVKVDVLSADATKLATGMPVTLTQWGGDRELSGTVRQVQPAGFTRLSALGIEEQRVPVHITLTSPQDKWDTLGTGYRVMAHITHAEHSDALTVPVSAIFHEDDQAHVLVIDGQRVRLTAVEIGAESGLRQHILDGLQAGQQVVTHPPADLTDGQRVRLD